MLGQYVNDRPFVASSFLSVAISQVFGTALAGRCKDRPELVKQPIPLAAQIDVLPVRGGSELVRKMFEPLGYAVEATGRVLDEQFPEWGESRYFSVRIEATTTLSALLTHLYVLIPVFDDEKHYFVGEAEMEKLLAKGEGWLPDHPAKDQITRRYLRHRPNLYREALARLAEAEPAGPEQESASGRQEESLEVPLSLNEQRLAAVTQALLASGARSVIDLGCGEGKLIRELLADRQFERIVGMDVSFRALENAARRLRLDGLPENRAGRVCVLHGSLMYRDARLAGFDAAAVVEVIEHLDAPRVAAFERVLFEFARPRTVVLTTPNREFNVMWETLPAGRLRHVDHRFEWTRAEFGDWTSGVADRHGYAVRIEPVGPVDGTVGAPTQMAIFDRKDP